MTYRAMLRLGKDQDTLAFQDATAAVRWAAHVYSGPFVVDLFIGAALQRMAVAPFLTALSQQRLSREALRQALIEIRQSPPFPPLSRRIDLGERIVALSELIVMASTGLTARAARDHLAKNYFLTKNDPLVELLTALDTQPVHTDAALQRVNQAHDRYLRIVEQASLRDRVESLKQREKEDRNPSSSAS